MLGQLLLTDHRVGARLDEGLGRGDSVGLNVGVNAAPSMIAAVTIQTRRDVVDPAGHLRPDPESRSSDSPPSAPLGQNAQRPGGTSRENGPTPGGRSA